MVSDVTQDGLVEAWNATRTAFPGTELLHELFEDQALRTPDAPALSHFESVLTYRELNEAANRLAHRLRSLGVGPDRAVVIGMDPAPEMVIGILGILKAGGAYVPVDPSTPAARVSLILSDTRAGVVLTQQKLASLWTGFRGKVLALDILGDELSRLPVTKPASGVQPDNLAYITYTSGSTGVPKGVMVAHRGITNTMRFRQHGLPQRPSDRQLQNFSFTFDASVGEIFGPLQAGGCLVVIEGDSAKDMGRFVETIIRRKITVFGINPSRLHLVLDNPRFKDCTTLRRVMVGGEALALEDRRRLFATFDVELHNLYGPTEISLDATHWDCRQDPNRNVIPIGKPICNQRTYILDERLRPVPVGEIGELYVGGVGVTRGYLNNPALTADRFIPDPFSGEPGSRLYRTGDACRWLPDGAIQFLDRVDQQVKIRGYRIELGEIDAALKKHPSLREAAVIAREDGAGDRQLVAYVVAGHKGHESNGSAPVVSASDLRSFLKQHLPEYMVPAAFVALPALPRMPSGKLDLRALPSPNATTQAAETKDVARGPLEAYLASLWQEILGVRGFGDDDSFFDLGGNSLKVAVLIHRLEKEFGEYFYTVALYDAPTLAKLAHYLRVNYPASVTRLFGAAAMGDVVNEQIGKVDEARFAAFAQQVKHLPARLPKNPPAVFVLSPPRSGSTLFRIMLGGHPKLFAPPELQLLNYNTLRERKAALSSNRDDFWLEGTVRAIMEIRRCTPEEAQRIMDDCEARDMSVKEFYALLQGWLGDVAFVEKTPTYAFDIHTLRRAEEDFANAKFIHLIRHPSPMISSFEEAKLHVFMPPFYHGELPANVWEHAELVWLLCHRNIVRFLDDIPAERKHAVRFEELVKEPKRVMQGVAEFLGLEFHEHMADPYKEDNKSRMTDAINPLARMLGDVKFHSHGAVQATQAERKKGRYPEEKLGEITKRMAESLGYTFKVPAAPLPSATMTAAVAAPRSSLAPLQPNGSARPWFCVHPGGGGVSCYQKLARLLGPDQPVYGFQAAGLDNDGPLRPPTVPEMAAAYLAELRRVQPRGPYRLGGWSIGGVIAFEMALQLQQAGEEIEFLAAIDSVVLDCTLPHPPLLSGELLLEFAQGYGLEVGPRVLRRLPKPRRLGYLLRQAKESGLAPASLDLADFRVLYRRHTRVFRNNVAAVRAYAPQGQSRKVVLFEAGDRTTAAAPGPTLSWKSLAGEVEHHRLSGTHYGLLREPNVHELARRLREHLQAERNSPEGGRT